MTTTFELTTTPTVFSSQTVENLYDNLLSDLVSEVTDITSLTRMSKTLKAIINVANIDDDVEEAAEGII